MAIASSGVGISGILVELVPAACPAASLQRTAARFEGLDEKNGNNRRRFNDLGSRQGPRE